MEPKYILTTLLIAFKIYVIFNFILKYRKMTKRVKFLENENKSLQLLIANTTN